MTERSQENRSDEARSEANPDHVSPSSGTSSESQHRWTFLSNHAHVLVCLAIDPESRIRDVATRIGITERAVTKIIGDLEQEGLLSRSREGRRNSYQLSLDKPLRHPIEAHRNVGELVSLILKGTPER